MTPTVTSPSEHSGWSRNIVSTPLAASSTSPQLPVEVWENVIDNIEPLPDALGISLPSRKYLAACSEVCRSWQPRCLFHLYKRLVLSSASDLEAIVRRLEISAGLADRVQFLDLVCKSLNQSWVCLVPLRLPHMKNLQALSIDGLDLTTAIRPPHFYLTFRQLRHESLPLSHAPNRPWHLFLKNITYSRYAQVNQLISALNPLNVTLSSQVQPELSPGNSPGSLSISATNITITAMSSSQLSAACRDWHFPHASTISIHLSELDTPDAQGEILSVDEESWRRIVDSLFSYWFIAERVLLPFCWCYLHKQTQTVGSLAATLVLPSLEPSRISRTGFARSQRPGVQCTASTYPPPKPSLRYVVNPTPTPRVSSMLWTTRSRTPTFLSSQP
ncbi:hypothetical protein BXZ70DRAFT_389299 [Cristinia sonorae]|uniref:F-box domain-containing protein n=1 Tax=Cristinia sonorae TaxID=1940300 RepID=A0A8K0XMF1_9AGAR|nr:hypothetical protein BXZ70DRAFT_389299 [Cristinia sonorae]